MATVEERIAAVAKRVNVDPFDVFRRGSVNEAIASLAFLLQQESNHATFPPDVVATLSITLPVLAESVELDGTADAARLKNDLREAAGVAQRLQSLLDSVSEYKRAKDG